MSVATCVERRLEGALGTRGVRFVEFLGVGATGMVVDLIIVVAVLGAGGHYLVANALGFLVAVSWNFVGNWLYVFDRPDGSIPRQYVAYVAWHALTFGVRAIVLTALIESAGVPVMVATAVGIGAAAVANYLGTETILEDGVGDRLNQFAHVVYSSRVRRVLRDVGLYGPIYGAYSRVLAAIYREDVLEIFVGDASARIHTETPPEIISVLHTLEKERPVIEEFLDGLDEDATVWDVGANLGVYSVLAADVADEVVAFEPVPSTTDRLEENLRLNDADDLAITVALSDHTGQDTIGLERDEVGTQTPALDEDLIDSREEIVVDVETGDNLVAQDVPTPDAVKIDVEGAERDVLDGMYQTLIDDVERVLVEVHGARYGAGPFIDGYLRLAGFDVKLLEYAGQTYVRGEKT